MAKVVCEAQSLRQILVEPQRASHRPPDLRDFEAVRQPHPIMIAVGRHEHLGLVAQAPERDRVDQPIAIALEDIACTARATAILGVEPSARSFGAGCNKRRKFHSPASGAIRSAWEFVKFDAGMPTVSKSSASVSASERPRNGPTSSRAPPAVRAT